MPGAVCGSIDLATSQGRAGRCVFGCWQRRARDASPVLFVAWQPHPRLTEGLATPCPAASERVFRRGCNVRAGDTPTCGWVHWGKRACGVAARAHAARAYCTKLATLPLLARLCQHSVASGVRRTVSNALCTAPNTAPSAAPSTAPIAHAVFFLFFLFFFAPKLWLFGGVCAAPVTDTNTCHTSLSAFVAHGCTPAWGAVRPATCQQSLPSSQHCHVCVRACDQRMLFCRGCVGSCAHRGEWRQTTTRPRSTQPSHCCHCHSVTHASGCTHTHHPHTHTPLHCLLPAIAAASIIIAGGVWRGMVRVASCTCMAAGARITHAWTHARRASATGFAREGGAAGGPSTTRGRSAAGRAVRVLAAGMLPGGSNTPTACFDPMYWLV